MARLATPTFEPRPKDRLRAMQLVRHQLKERRLAVTVPLRDGRFRRNVRVARLNDACWCRADRPSALREASGGPLATEARARRVDTLLSGFVRMALTHGALHAAIGRHFIDHGTAPSIAQLSQTFALDEEVIADALRALADYHGVVLHPTSSEIWAMHPFSSAPTLFWVESGGRGWWGNCAWCSLGIVALLGANATITTRLGGEATPATLRIEHGAVRPSDYVVHFPIPMTQAWDNVTYTCSTMLVFETPDAVDRWCARHAMPRGDVQPLSNVWAFAQAWYGRHLDPHWTKWTTEEARELFERFGLTSPTWALPETPERF